MSEHTPKHYRSLLAPKALLLIYSVCISQEAFGEALKQPKQANCMEISCKFASLPPSKPVYTAPSKAEEMCENKNKTVAFRRNACVLT